MGFFVEVLLNTGVKNITIDLLLVFLELDVVLYDIDVGGFEKAANFSHIGGTDHGIGMEACHRF